MNNNLKRKNLFGILGVLIFIISFPVMYMLSDDIISRICLGFMLVFVLWAYLTGLIKLYKATNDINRAALFIKEEKENHKELWTVIYEKEDFFLYSYLKSAFEAFKKEMKRLERAEDTSYKCDIADYINIDDIEDASNRGYLEQVGALFTGLGILGTFIGLTIGLQKFDSTSAEAMASTIPALIEGIKIAFYTSIFGVGLSLIFNLVYKNSLFKLNEALESFYEEFYLNVVPLPDNDLANQMLRYQQEQSSTMVKFAETISVKIAESFEKVALPTFNNINNTMTMLSEKMIENQTEGLETIVNEFVNHMNTSLNGQFLELGKTLESMNEWEKNMIGEVQRVVEELINSSENITGVNLKLDSIMEKLSTFCNELNSFQVGVNKAYESVDKQREVFERSLAGQELYLRGLQDHEAALLTKFSEIIIKVEELLKTSEGQMEVNNNITEALNNKLNSSAEVLKEVSAAFNKDIEASAKSLGAVTETFNDEIRKSSQGMKDITDSFQEGIKETAGSVKVIAQEFNNDIAISIKLLKDSGEEFIQRLHHYFGQIEQISSSTASLFNNGIDLAAKRMEELLKSYNEDLYKAAGEMKGIGGGFREELNASALMLQDVFKELNKELGASAKELEGICLRFNETVAKSVQVSNDITETFKKDVNYSVKKTFEVFDTSLSEISIHLSGTIKEIQETVDKLPMVENEYLHKIKEQYDGYVEELVKVQKDIKGFMIELLDEAAKEKASGSKEKKILISAIPQDFNHKGAVGKEGEV
ncbi:MotA/TolQ/ExbB proton channel family protein [Alloiococcus sp. CFN-8]|uniref:MotA/TolQ/ExbB proton channel family protein n=1 Tax=Alloiococcus sp. CFN-8 TaxID=3416081 RepID=UPI003CEEC810